jgi:hypothetical protein
MCRGSWHVNMIRALLQLHRQVNGVAVVNVACDHWSTEGSSTIFCIQFQLENGRHTPWIPEKCADPLRSFRCFSKIWISYVGPDFPNSWVSGRNFRPPTLYKGMFDSPPGTALGFNRQRDVPSQCPAPLCSEGNNVLATVRQGFGC